MFTGQPKGSRFNLLLLEDAEYYLEDFRAYLFPPMAGFRSIEAWEARKAAGRLKLCTKGIVFEPDQVAAPVTRFPFKSFSEAPTKKAVKGVPGFDKLLSVSCDTLVEMKANNVIGPYVTRKLDKHRTRLFGFEHTDVNTVLDLLERLVRATQDKDFATIEELVESRRSTEFDASLLEDYLETPEVPRALPVDKVAPLVRIPGCLMITGDRLYFQPAQVNNLGEPVVKVRLDEVRRVFRRRYLLRNVGLELYTGERRAGGAAGARARAARRGADGSRKAHGGEDEEGEEDADEDEDEDDGGALDDHSLVQPSAPGGGPAGHTLFLAFASPADRDLAYTTLLRIAPSLAPEARALAPLVERAREARGAEEAHRAAVALDGAWRAREVLRAMRLWQRRKIGNFAYLMRLNVLADRSFADLTQYPVLPWVLSDYTSTHLDLASPQSFRDLSKPVGALNPTRLEISRRRFREMPAGEHPPPFLYGTHYSTPGYVLFSLVRQAPEHMLHLQAGRFDAPDRMFSSVAQSWESVLTNPADLKELIPEFYASSGDFLVNASNLDMGVCQNGQRVHHVELPPWAQSPEDFVRKMKEALESDHVSARLHHWVDLIFGFKQRGPAAVEADNLFYYLTYEGSVDLDSITDPLERASYEAQIREFGQCPKQLFALAHPRRNDAPLPPSGQEAQALVDVPPPGPDPTAKPGASGSDASAGSGASSSSAAAAPATGGHAGASSGGRAASEGEHAPLSGAQKLLGSLTQRLRIGQAGEEVPAVSAAEVEAEVEDAGPAAAGTSEGPTRHALRSSLTEEQRARLRAAEEQYASDAQGESGRLAPSRMALSTLRAAASVAPTGGEGGEGGDGPGRPLGRTRAVTEGGDEAAGLRLRGDHWTNLARGTATVPLALHRAPVTCVVLRRQRGRRHRLGEGLLAGGEGEGGGEAAQGSEDSFVAYTTSEDSTLKLAEVRPRAEEPQGGAVRGVHAEVPDAYRAFGDAMRHLQSASTLPVGAQWVQKRSVSVSSLSLAACAVPAMDPSIVMVGSWDNHAYLYAIEFGRVLDRVPAHDDAVVAVALQGSRPWMSSPVYRGTNSYGAARRQLHDGLFALTGSWDSTVKLWQLRSTGLSREPLRSVCEHDVEVRAVDLSPCGRLAVSASEAGAIAVHDVRAKTSSGDVVQRAESSVTAVQWDCEGRAFVACTEKGTLMHCSIDGTVMTQLDARGASTVLATDGHFAATAGESSQVKLWDLGLGKCVGTLEPPELLQGRPITSLSIADDFHAVSAGFSTGHVVVWE